MLLGIYGHAGVGKDTVAHHLGNTFSRTKMKRFAFADPLKDACSAAFAIPVENFHNPELKEIVHPYWGKSPRQIAQWMGTEVFRNMVSHDHWIKVMGLKFLTHFQDDTHIHAVITDVRFYNEAEFILKHGGFILHLTRPGKDGAVGIANHQSEAGIDLKQFNRPERMFICENNSTLPELYRKIDDIYDVILSYHTPPLSKL